MHLLQKESLYLVSIKIIKRDKKKRKDFHQAFLCLCRVESSRSQIAGVSLSPSL